MADEENVDVENKGNAENENAENVETPENVETAENTENVEATPEVVTETPAEIPETTDVPPTEGEQEEKKEPGDSVQEEAPSLQGDDATLFNESVDISVTTEAAEGVEEGAEAEGLAEAEGKPLEASESALEATGEIIEAVITAAIGGEEEMAEEGREEGKVKFEKGEGEDLVSEVSTKKQMRKRRASVMSRRKSIAYKPTARIREEEDDRRISGDFTAAEAVLLESKISIETYIPSFEDYEDEEEEEEEIIEEEIPEPVDREYYYELHKNLVQERISHKMKNNFLQKKMAEYFKKRKMEHVLKDTDQQVDTVQRYNKRLDALGELLQLDHYQRTTINEELKEMKEQRDDQFKKVNASFASIQTREKEIGIGLINTKTGKQIPDKLVERLIRRQEAQKNQVAELRLKYIKIRNLVTEKQMQLRNLDEIAPGLHLIDYEQLKIENQSHSDKIEERDEELTRLRIRCQNAMQCLAHVREKCSACEIDIQTLTDRLREVEIECMECRERTTYFKVERDSYRQQIEKLIDDSGLLTKPKLLLDMEDAIAEADTIAAELKRLQEDYEKNHENLMAIRKNIENANIKCLKKQQVRIHEPNKHGLRVYKGRPTLLCPTLPPSEGSDFTEI